MPSANPSNPASKPEQPGFRQDHPADLPGGRPEISDQADFAAAVQYQC